MDLSEPDLLIQLCKRENKCSQTDALKVFFYLCISGMNLQGLIEQAKQLTSSAEMVVVISNRPGVHCPKRASLAGIQTQVSRI